MATDSLFDQIPSGYKRSKRGWIQPMPNPHAGAMKNLADENAALKAAHDDLVARLEALEAAISVPADIPVDAPDTPDASTPIAKGKSRKTTK